MTYEEAIMCVGVILGAGLLVFAAAYGISKIASKAMEAIARQPGASTDIKDAMRLPLALIEGAVMFGLVICLLIVLVKK